MLRPREQRHAGPTAAHSCPSAHVVRYATPRSYGGAPDADYLITQGAPPPPAVAYRCRVSAQFASVDLRAPGRGGF